MFIEYGMKKADCPEITCHNPEKELYRQILFAAEHCTLDYLPSPRARVLDIRRIQWQKYARFVEKVQ